MSECPGSLGCNSFMVNPALHLLVTSACEYLLNPLDEGTGIPHPGVFSNRPLKNFFLEIGIKNTCPNDNYISLHLCNDLQFASVRNDLFHIHSSPVS